MVLLRKFKFDKFVPSSIILVVDLLLIIFSFFITQIILDISLHEQYSIRQNILIKLFLVTTVSVFFLIIFRINKQLIRLSTNKDLLKVGYSLFFIFLSLFIISVFINNYNLQIFFRREIVLFVLVSFITLVSFRIFIREFFLFADINLKKNKKDHVFVVDCSMKSLLLAESINTNKNSKFKVEGFVSSTIIKSNHVFGKKALSIENFLKYLEKNNVNGLVFPDFNVINEYKFLIESVSKLNQKIYIGDRLEERGIKKNVIKQINIEDLLSRSSININDSTVKSFIDGKKILITGAAGSIGSEICRQVLKYNPSEVIILDFAESPLHNLYQDAINMGNYKAEVKCFFCDIRSRSSLEKLFKENLNIDVIFHAAALKHVPLMEEYPMHAIATNIIGTINLTELAIEYNVSNFVFISTDKAVNPTNVMGATKRASEIYLKCISHSHNKTKFVATRFGNVLGSNGSVVPHFEKQIASGGPVTVTHKEITRYFMTIPEACQHVLQASSMANGGEIFVFDMGAPVKIIDLAKRMIRLSGFEVNKDIKIKITGLRPGEKLYEELLTEQTTNLATYHNKIKILSEGYILHDVNIFKLFKKLEDFETLESFELVSILKTIVPEYKSKNSVYEELDDKIK